MQQYIISQLKNLYIYITESFNHTYRMTQFDVPIGEEVRTAEISSDNLDKYKIGQQLVW